MTTITEFMKSEKPGQRPNSGSKLDAHSQEIRQLISAGYSRSQIMRYLETNGLKVTLQSVSTWMNKNELNPPKGNGAA